MDLQLTDRRAAIAASTSGLGLATARSLAAEGARVVICGRDGDRLARARDGFPDPSRVEAVIADVSTEAGAIGFVQEARERLGGLDILVPNAGGPPAGDFSSTPLDRYRPALELNLLSTVAMCHEAVPQMIEVGWGRIVAITSVTVREPSATLILSNTARAGATAFLKTLAREIAPHGVTVNSVQPGLHATPRMAELHGGDVDGSHIPVGTTGRPEDFGAVVTFLCSDQARFITGAALPVDGGLSHALQ